MTDKETIALLSQIIAETAEELGCENDNEAILQAIHDLKQRASLPSPPVSGEADCPSCDGKGFHLGYIEDGNSQMMAVPENCDMCGGSGAIQTLSPLTNKPVGQFDTSDYIIVGSDGRPRRNEPVGVTISRELAEDIHKALEDLGACPDDECTQCKRVLPRLSASITG